MSDDSSHEVKPLMRFAEGLHYYFAAGNELYEANVKRESKDTIDRLQEFGDALLASLTEAADKAGVGKELREAVRDEQGQEKLTLWIRITANRLQAARPGALSLELLGSAGVVIAVAYYILHAGTTGALLSGVAIIALRMSLPWAMDRIATR